MVVGELWLHLACAIGGTVNERERQSHDPCGQVHVVAPLSGGLA